MAQTQAGWHTTNTKNMEGEESQAVFSDFERDSLLTHLKLVPTKKYFLSVTKILGKTNDAQDSYKSI